MKNWSYVRGVGWLDVRSERKASSEVERAKTLEVSRVKRLSEMSRVMTALEKRIAAEPALQVQLARNVQSWAEQAGFRVDHSAQRMKEDPNEDPDSGPGPGGGGGGALMPQITVESFIWGFHFVIPHEALQVIVTGADSVNTFVSLIAPETGPAGPFVELAAALVGKMIEVMGDMDEGNGIYFSMSWFLPGVFVPTPIS